MIENCRCLIRLFIVAYRCVSPKKLNVSFWPFVVLTQMQRCHKSSAGELNSQISQVVQWSKA